MTSVAKQQIDEQSAKWMEYYASQQWKKLSELYTEDCKVYPPGRPIGVGRAETANAWKMVNELFGAARIVLDNVEVEYDGGEMAADRSTFKMYNSAGREINYGEYVVIWRRVTDRKSKSGVWQLHYDIFNSNVPAVKTVQTLIVEQSNKWEHFYATGDFNSLSALYTPDCKVFPPGRTIAEGRIGCARAWSRLKESGARYIKITNEETIEMGDGLASDYSSYKITDSRGKQIDHGKYVVIWKRLEDGQWYLHFDIFNSDVN